MTGHIRPWAENTRERCTHLRRANTTTPTPSSTPFTIAPSGSPNCGRICIGRRKINLSIVFACQSVGIREVADRIWLVSFMKYDLGFFDEEDNRVEPVGQNPFTPKLLPMSPE